MEYLPQTPHDQEEMLKTIGVASLEDLLREVPQAVRLKRPLRLSPPLSQFELIQEMEALSQKNTGANRHICFLGAGAYDHIIPPIVHHIISRSEFSTAYTPYQAEMSQGLLQAIYEYQTMISEITGMDVANASIYDGASALAEAALMALRITKRSTILLSDAIHPSYRQVAMTYLSGQKFPCTGIPLKDGRTDLDALKKVSWDTVAAVAIQHPNFLGCLEDAAAVERMAHRSGALLIIIADPLSLGLLKPPGEYGADIAVGEGQVLGSSLSFGGPYLGYFATRKDYVRQMPGRLVGATLDAAGRPGFCLTLQTREQHIRRERATSNICTNVTLTALAATVYLAALGTEGLKEVALSCLQKSHYAQAKMCALPEFERAFSPPFFKEFTIKSRRNPARINKKLLKAGILGGLDLGRFYPSLEGCLLFCVTEKRTKGEIDRLVDVLEGLA